MPTRIPSRRPRVLPWCTAAALAALAATVACGPSGESAKGGSSSGTLRTIGVGSKDYEAKEVTVPRNGAGGPAVVETINPAWITVDDPPVPATPIPLWEPVVVSKAFRDHCADCHYPFHFKENVEFNKVRVLVAVKDPGAPRPMPPVARNPNHTTFRNTDPGKAMIAFLEGQPVASPSPTPTATPSQWRYDDVTSVVQSTCVAGCHVSGGSASFAPLDSLVAVKSHRADMIARIESGNMPKATTPARAFPSEAGKSKLLDWLKNGTDAR